MKRIVVMTIVLSGVLQTNAQTFDEWFHQKKTQIKYLVQQITANEIYLACLQKGYNIAESGLKTISDIKKGDFKLHRDFFNSLKTVNPQIKNWERIADIISFQLQIIKEAISVVQRVQASNQFTSSEITYLQNVFNHLLDECIRDINDLITVTTSGEIESDSYRMKDDERIKRIDGIYNDMLGKLSFSKSFSADAAMLALQRSQEETGIEVSKKLNGLIP